MPPPPTHSSVIPSIHDNVALPLRIYHPLQASTATASDVSTPPCGAIVAHPYASMGGSHDDHIVLTLVDELLREGQIVSTFNFRGNPYSRAGTSWTAKAEVQDYISVVVFLIHYINDLQALQHPPSATIHAPPMIRLVLGGYSYGAMVVTLLPSLSSYFPTPSQSASDVASRLQDRALHLSRRTLSLSDPSLPPSPRPPTPPAPLPNVQLNYLLVSPIFGTIAHLATFFSASSARAQGEEKFLGKDAATLAVYGDRDGFTNAEKVTAWGKKMAKEWRKRNQEPAAVVQDAKAGGFRFEMIPDAGHFWREGYSEEEMRRVVREWLSRDLKISG